MILWLSHLEYGQRKLCVRPRLDPVAPDGILTWKRDPGVCLQPVTPVLALRQGANVRRPDSSFTDQDWLAHDAVMSWTWDPGLRGGSARPGSMGLIRWCGALKATTS